MKKYILMFLCFVVLFITSCKGNNHTHEHKFTDGICNCGEKDPNYVKPHEHVFVEGVCECGEVDPGYVAHECTKGTWVSPDGTKCLAIVTASKK